MSYRIGMNTNIYLLQTQRKDLSLDIIQRDLGDIKKNVLTNMFNS